MKYNLQNPDDIWFKSFLLKREVKLNELETLAQDELDYLMAETKARVKEEEITRELKFIANVFYELGMIKTLARERRDKDDSQ
jgi:hypothetical protein|tara:strand:+ start:1082 stop:1330 length:249 start_codon:yes stop_codon:yes gene_type:complete